MMRHDDSVYVLGGLIVLGAYAVAQRDWNLLIYAVIWKAIIIAAA